MLKIINAERRLVQGDINPARIAHQTRCDYSATVRAFQELGERMPTVQLGFDPCATVGMLTQWHSDDERQRIMVLTRISRGAEDAWQAIARGELVGVDMALSDATARMEGGVKVLSAFHLHCLGLLDAAGMGE